MINLAQNRSIPLQFATERLHVRRYAPHDADELYAAARESIDEVYPFLPWCHPEYQRKDAVGWIGMVKEGWDAGQEYNFLIRAREGGHFIGACGLNQIEDDHKANLGYWIRTSEAGHGYITEATRGLAHFGFEYLKLGRVEIVMSTRNQASRNVAERTGAKFEGTLRSRLNLHGENHDAYLYSLLPEDLNH